MPRRAFDVLTCTWSSRDLPRLLETLAPRHDRAGRSIDQPTDDFTDEQLHRWIDSVTLPLELDLATVEFRFRHLPASLRARAPVIIVMRTGNVMRAGNVRRFLCVLSASRYSVRLLLPNGAIRRVSAGSVHAALRANVSAPNADAVETILTRAGLAARQRQKVGAALTASYVGNRVAARGWAVRPSSGTAFLHQLRRSRLVHAACGVLAAQTLLVGAGILNWWMFGRATLTGWLDRGWLIAWILALVSWVAVSAYLQGLQGRLVLGFAALVRKRLMLGGLQAALRDVRAQGIGQVIGRTLEAESLELFGLTGFTIVSAAVTLVAAGILLWNVGGPSQVLLLALWIAVTFATAVALHRRRDAWSDRRLSLTHEIVEGLVGYRTRLAQEHPDGRHDREDRMLAEYLKASQGLDLVSTVLAPGIPRAWLVAALIGLSPLVLSADANNRIPLTIAIGGVLLAYNGFAQMAAGLSGLSEAAVSWRLMRPLLRASTQQPKAGRPTFAAMRPGRATSRQGDPSPALVLEGLGVTFSHNGNADAVLRGCNVRIHARDRILLEGPSGSGKSTLASLLAGLLDPDAGLLLLKGLDRSALGDHAWRKNVVLAPQFHENHVLADSFLFNLLMGRQWPPAPRDVAAAHQLCEQLGLGSLLRRMPAGLHQTLGDSGWQLSHGERARLYVARALLQDPDVLILDESFTGLDPFTLQECVRVVDDRAKAVVVIAHP